MALLMMLRSLFAALSPSSLSLSLSLPSSSPVLLPLSFLLVALLSVLLLLVALAVLLPALALLQAAARAAYWARRRDPHGAAIKLAPKVNAYSGAIVQRIARANRRGDEMEDVAKIIAESCADDEDRDDEDTSENDKGKAMEEVGSGREGAKEDGWEKETATTTTTTTTAATLRERTGARKESAQGAAEEKAEVRIGAPNKTQKKKQRKGGATCRVSTFFNDHAVILTADPEVVAWMLARNFENYVKGVHFTDIFRDFLGQVRGRAGKTRGKTGTGRKR